MNGIFEQMGGKKYFAGVGSDRAADAGEGVLSKLC
jgi:hypothetical protein